MSLILDQAVGRCSVSSRFRKATLQLELNLNRPIEYPTAMLFRQKLFLLQCKLFFRYPRLLMPMIRNEHRAATARLKSIALGAKAAGRSLVFVGSHYGNYVASFCIISRALPGDVKCCIPVNLAERALALGNKRLPPVAGREFELISIAERSAARKMIETLKGGGALGVLFDLPPAYGRAHKQTFLRADAAFASGWLSLAYSTRAIVVPFASNCPNGSFEIGEPFDPLMYSNYETFSKEMLAKLTSALEVKILKAPEYWHMLGSLHKFFSGEGWEKIGSDPP